MSPARSALANVEADVVETLSQLSLVEATQPPEAATWLASEALSAFGLPADLDLDRHAPMSRLQKSWLSKVLSPLSIHRFEAMTIGQRLEFGSNLGDAYMQLENAKDTEIVKRERVQQLVKMMAGASGINIAEETGVDPVTVSRNINKIAESLNTGMEGGEVDIMLSSVKKVKKPAKTVTAVRANGTAEYDHISVLADHPLLTADEEIALAKQIEQGDAEARKRFIECNVRLVISRVYKLYPQGIGTLSPEDLISEGFKGLIKGVERFDYRRGNRFSTFGTIQINRALQLAVQDYSRTIRWPQSVSRANAKIRKAENEYLQQHEKEPSTEELIAITGLSEEVIKDVMQARKKRNAIPSLDEKVGPDKDGETRWGLLPSDNAPVDEQTIFNIHRKRLYRHLDYLREPYRAALTLYFFPADGRQQSYSNVGEALGVSHVTAGRYINRGLSMMRKLLESDGIDAQDLYEI